MIHARLGKKLAPSFSLDVEFEIPGGVTALYGPEGSGKTQILEMLTGLLRPDSGRILHDDVLVFDAQAGVNVPARKRSYGYLPPRDSLFPHMTVRKNLAFAAKVPRLERHRRVGEMLERFELTDAGPRRPGEIRPGQRLRAAAARALIAAPKLLLVDAPEFSEPDFQQVRTVFDGPVVIATRDLDLACALADQMLVLDSGRILRRGTPREVLDQPQSPRAARLLGYRNVFEATITGLDPGRNSSRLEIASAVGPFELAVPYLPGHFKGDRVSIGIRAEHVRVYAAGTPAPPNAQPAQLVRVWRHVHLVRLEFAGGITADVPPDEYARQKDNKSWQVEFPSEALRIL